jgi:hypothetical protein
MLGISVSVMYLLARRYLSHQAAAVYLGVSAIFMYIDWFRYYNFRLLSENLLIFYCHPC